jgi:hypothetical protein
MNAAYARLAAHDGESGGPSLGGIPARQGWRLNESGRQLRRPAMADADNCLP